MVVAAAGRSAAARADRAGVGVAGKGAEGSGAALWGAHGMACGFPLVAAGRSVSKPSVHGFESAQAVFQLPLRVGFLATA